MTSLESEQYHCCRNDTGESYTLVERFFAKPRITFAGTPTFYKVLY